MYIQANQLVTINPIGENQQKVFDAWAKEKNVFTLSKKNSLGFSPRLHVMKWGSQRGK